MNQEVLIFKQVAVRWLNNQLHQILSGNLAKFVEPFAEELLANLSQSPVVDSVLGMFVDSEGNFNIDKLLDKYIDVFTREGDIRFKWGDISPKLAFIDAITGNKTIVITADDIRELKDSFLRAS